MTTIDQFPLVLFSVNIKTHNGVFNKWLFTSITGVWCLGRKHVDLFGENSTVMRLLQLLPSLSGCVYLFPQVHWCAGVCVGVGVMVTSE